MKNIKTLSPTPPNCPAATTLFLYGNLEMKSIPDDFFEHMNHLKVLHLSFTTLISLSSSISHLHNCLRFIKLQNCLSLETFPPSFKYLESLQLLDLRNTPLSRLLDDSFDHMYSLRLLDLSHTEICSLSSSICSCCKLKQLFIKASHLPISYTSIKKLLLAHCKALVFVFVPHLQQLPALRELDISGCIVLGLENIPLNGCMPNVRLRNMTGSLTQTASLSLKVFWSSETIQLPHIANLEYLELSGNKIKEFPYDICELTCLKCLDLVNMRQLKRVQWEKIKWLPQILNWDQCGYYNFKHDRGCLSSETQQTSANEGGAFAIISVSNANIFETLNDSSPLWENCFT
ncbi:hypothetical protein MRB53_023618 [Persea americana]|uniref:Uncharacterized protein n=1 Tax=Persea americana TaxID=3435 RepID=A0ACC2LAC7_PERAE|nr:hypothetical protein MRB53_023618 [Persea americana]